MSYGVFTENDHFLARGVLLKKHIHPTPGETTMSDPAHILKPATDEAPAKSSTLPMPSHNSRWNIASGSSRW